MNSILLKTMGGDNIQRSFLKFKLPDAEDRGYGDGRIPFAGIPAGPEENTYRRSTPRKTAMVLCYPGLEQPSGIRRDSWKTSLTYTDDKQQYISLDITNLVKKLVHQVVENYGLMVKDAYELSGYTEYLCFRLRQWHLKKCVRRSRFPYVNNSGLEDYWSYHSQDAGRAGEVHVNDYNGNLILIRE